MRKSALVVIVLAALVALWRPAAAASDPAAAVVTAFQDETLAIMKAGPRLGAQGRYDRFLPLTERAFDFPVMMAYAAGPAWSGMSAADRRMLIAAFARLTAASYAHNFDRWSGERFEVDPKVVVRGPDHIVTGRIVPALGAPTTLLYRMRQSGGGWKIIDVYYGAVSQLTTRRADFAGPLASGGAAGLQRHLTELVAHLLK
ncbi:MAG TPA: ABC transporter substrate-binding protein [Caulobacteraceae bacterium]|nr:ABC transporter substrate-binding protein [Caulobacteraceae bacterium]